MFETNQFPQNSSISYWLSLLFQYPIRLVDHIELLNPRICSSSFPWLGPPKKNLTLAVGVFLWWLFLDVENWITAKPPVRWSDGTRRYFISSMTERKSEAIWQGMN